MLTWLHFGDLHASNEDDWESLRLLSRISKDADRHLAWTTDFAILPGDNANHGEPAQYRRIRAVLDDLGLRWFAIPGDHDFEPKSLSNFYQGLGAQRLPISVRIKGRRCIFLDIISPGQGGPDFRLGAEQTAWLKGQLEQSEADPERPVVFMHAFPGDLAEGAEALADLFADHRVACVDTGHTHYNEVLNDGRVIYTATRSTGQIEEGPPGFSLHVIDGSAVSWRFKLLDSPWPFVLITSPADRRIVVAPVQAHQAPCRSLAVRARVFGEDVDRVALSVGDRAPVAMAPAPGSAGLWTVEVAGVGDGRHRLKVTAASSLGEVDSDIIEIDVSAIGHGAEKGSKPGPGGHAHSIGAWPEHGLLGTQLGPNKNGTIKW